VIFGFWNGLQLMLGTPYPVLAVASGSMCKINGPRCEGVFNPFDPTLHKGDIIIVQNVDKTTIRTGKDPIGDIIVFKKPNSSTDELIVHRAIDNEVINGTIYFRTKGDANNSNDTHTGPETYRGMVSQKFVIGKVIMRVPWIGHIALLMRNSYGPSIIVMLIIIVVIIEFLFPIIMRKSKHDSEVKEELAT
jgi:signal peptidase